MRLSLFLFFSAVLFPILCVAQDFENFGQIAPEELALIECSFDKDAQAIVLLDEATGTDNENYNLIIYRHIRIKILKESGIKNADIEIPYYHKDNAQFVDKIEGTTTNLLQNGQVEITELDRKAIYNKEINSFWSSTTFAFPNIKVGSIIEYKYRITSTNYGFLNDWNFHDKLPTVKSAFTLYIPPKLEFAYRVSKLPEYPITIKNEQGSGKVYFEMNNIPGLDDEAFMDARKDYIQKVTFQLSAYNNSFSGYQKSNTTWQEVIYDFLNSSNFGTQLKKNLSGTDDFITGVKKLTTDEEKIHAVYEFVRRSISWDGFNSLATDGIKDAWSKRRGTNGEINLILVNLLRDADVDACPLLVSERQHGKVNTSYPFIDQFNTTYAYVKTAAKTFYLNAAQKYYTAATIPVEILNTTALVINRKKGGLITVTNTNLDYLDFFTTMVNVDTNGKIGGTAVIKSEGYARQEKLSVLRDKGNEYYVRSHYSNQQFLVDSFECLNKHNDTLSLEQNIAFSGNLKSASGGYYFLALNNFMGFTTNPFISQKRFSHVNFGYKRKVSTYCSIQLPKNFVIEELPKSISMVTPDKDISFVRSVDYNKEEHLVVVMFNLDFAKSTYDNDEYDILHQMYKKMFDFLQEPLVLKNN
jgi:hypothetical protein